jgi:hypothetical protein
MAASRLAGSGVLAIIGSWVAAADAAAKPVLRILVTHDDGYAAPGINAVVQALRALPHTTVVVVAPATNESGSGGKPTSGTITAGAARAAAAFGVPALAASQRVDNSAAPNFAQSAAQVVHRVQTHRTALVKRCFRASQSPLMSVPTCPGPVRGPVHEPLGSSLAGVNVLQVNCSSTTKFTNDVQAFINGDAVIPLLGKAS